MKTDHRRNIFSNLCSGQQYYVFAGRNGFKYNFSPILLSERNIGIDHIDNIFEHHEKPL